MSTSNQLSFFFVVVLILHSLYHINNTGVKLLPASTGAENAHVQVQQDRIAERHNGEEEEEEDMLEDRRGRHLVWCPRLHLVQKKKKNIVRTYVAGRCVASSTT